MNFETARQMVTKLEGIGPRIEVLDLAEQAYMTLVNSSSKNIEVTLPQEDFGIVNRYKKASEALQEAVKNLSEESMDLARDHGKWTIREIVHHIVECDLNYFQINRYALANTGAKYLFNEFDAHLWKENMEHSNRSVHIEVKLFEMMRNYIAYLCETLPNALDRILIHQNGQATVRDALKHDIEHSYHHIEQILETRRVHKV